MTSQYRCETCKNWDKFFHGCKKTFYKEGGLGRIHPTMKEGDDWLINQVGCASHSDFNPQAEREMQCETCKHKGTRACMSHGYDELPRSCPYKLGVDAEEAMRNLNGTHIDVWTLEHDKIVREKVLDEMCDFVRSIVKEMRANGLKCDWNKPSVGYESISIRSIVEKIKELREGKDGE